MAKDTKVYSHHVRAIYKVPGGAAARAGGTTGIVMDGGSSPAAPRPVWADRPHGVVGSTGPLGYRWRHGWMDGWMSGWVSGGMGD